MIDETHVQDEVVALVEDVLVGGNVVADEVVRLPPAEKRKPRPDFELDGVVHDPECGRRDVADVVAVVSVGGCEIIQGGLRRKPV